MLSKLDSTTPGQIMLFVGFSLAIIGCIVGISLFSSNPVILTLCTNLITFIIGHFTGLKFPHILQVAAQKIEAIAAHEVATADVEAPATTADEVSLNGNSPDQQETHSTILSELPEHLARTESQRHIEAPIYQNSP